MTVQKILDGDAPAANLLVRLLVGGVFFLEGIKKFLFLEQWGVGRFTHIARFPGAIRRCG